MPLPYYFQKWANLKDSYLQFRIKRRQHLAAAKQLLLEGTGRNGTEDVASVLEKVRKDDEQLWLWMVLHYRLPVLTIAAFLLAVFCCFLICHRPDPNIRLELQVSTAEITLVKEKNWKWRPSSPLAATSIFLEGGFKLTAPGLGLNNTVETLTVSGNSIPLQHIEITGESRLEAEQHDDFIHLYIHEGKIQGSFELQEYELTNSPNNLLITTRISKSIPETLNFSGAVEGSQPLHMRLRTEKDFQLDGLRISSMDFQREDLPRSGSFVSAILGGKVSLPDIKREISIEENDWVRLKNPSSTRLRLTFTTSSKNSYNLFFQGSADSLSAGPEDFEQDVTPSLLIWIYHQWEKSELGIFCAVLAVMLGLFWKIHSSLKIK